MEDAAEGSATPRSHGPAGRVHLAQGRASVALGDAADELWTRPPVASTTCGQHELDSVLHTLLDRRVAPFGAGAGAGACVPSRLGGAAMWWADRGDRRVALVGVRARWCMRVPACRADWTGTGSGVGPEQGPHVHRKTIAQGAQCLRHPGEGAAPAGFHHIRWQVLVPGNTPGGRIRCAEANQRHTVQRAVVQGIRDFFCCEDRSRGARGRPRGGLGGSGRRRRCRSVTGMLRSSPCTRGRRRRDRSCAPG